jgi:excisionase family DNA binding protein
VTRRKQETKQIVRLANAVNVTKAKEMKLLTPKQLADCLNVKPGTVYSWISRGVDIPHIKIQGTLRFRQEAVDTWLLDREKAKKKRNFEL